MTFLKDNQLAIACQNLKTQFNLVLQTTSEEEDEAMYMKIMPVLTALLYAHTTCEEKLMELRNNIANLLTRYATNYYSLLNLA